MASNIAVPLKPEKHLVALLGPAFVASIAYVDPGNVAANISAGAEFGYLLVWVLVAASAMAVLVQYLSAKLGIVTGQSLPQILGEALSRRARLAYWAQAEAIAAATDLAEVVGGAIALNILFGLPMMLGGLIVSAVSLGLLAVHTTNGSHRFERVLIGLLAVITFGFVAGLFVSPFSWSGAAAGLIPRFDGSHSVLLAASMLGATVMPHVIYAHSDLTRERFRSSPSTREVSVGHIHRLLRATKWDVLLALGVAGTVNVAMLLLAAASLHGVTLPAGVPPTSTIEGAHAAISTALGPSLGVIFGIGLLVSGLASTSVGSYAGAGIMRGLLRIRVPLAIRRIVTLIPALVVIALGIDGTTALVVSQAVLSLGIPFALIPLVHLTSRRRVMGAFTNGPLTRWTAITVTTAIVSLNITLVTLVVLGQA